MRFNLTIELGNDAMRTSADVERALLEAARHGVGTSDMLPGHSGVIRDVNGNTVGRWEVTEEE